MFTDPLFQSCTHRIDSYFDRGQEKLSTTEGIKYCQEDIFSSTWLTSKCCVYDYLIFVTLDITTTAVLTKLDFWTLTLTMKVTI